MLAVLVANGTHDEVDPERREAEGASEGRAGAEVVPRRAVEVLEGQVRLWCMRRNGECGCRQGMNNADTESVSKLRFVEGQRGASTSAECDKVCEHGG